MQDWHTRRGLLTTVNTANAATYRCNCCHFSDTRKGNVIKHIASCQRFHERYDAICAQSYQGTIDLNSAIAQLHNAQNACRQLNEEVARLRHENTVLRDGCSNPTNNFNEQPQRNNPSESNDSTSMNPSQLQGRIKGLEAQLRSLQEQVTTQNARLQSIEHGSTYGVSDGSSHFDDLFPDVLSTSEVQLTTQTTIINDNNEITAPSTHQGSEAEQRIENQQMNENEMKYNSSQSTENLSIEMFLLEDNESAPRSNFAHNSNEIDPAQEIQELRLKIEELNKQIETQSMRGKLIRNTIGSIAGQLLDLSENLDTSTQTHFGQSYQVRYIQTDSNLDATHSSVLTQKQQNKELSKSPNFSKKDAHEIVSTEFSLPISLKPTKQNDDEENLSDLTERMSLSTRRYGMEIPTESEYVAALRVLLQDHMSNEYTNAKEIVEIFKDSIDLSSSNCDNLD